MPMCATVLQCVTMCLQHIGLLDTFGHIGISQCVPQCARATMCFAMCCLRISQCVQNTLTFNVLQCAFNVFSMCFFAHWNTLKHIVVIVAQLHKNVPDYNVFQCVTMCLQWALKTHSMGFNVPPMFFQCVSCTLGYCTILNVQKTHWKNIERHIDAHSMCF